jgi:hypothetical protein
MHSKSQPPGAETIEQEIAERIAAANIRLRFDKAVMRLVGRLKAALTAGIPEDQTIVFTVSAPIKLPAKTATALESLVRNALQGGDFRSILHGNQIQVRRVTGVSSNMPRVVGFVHNPTSDGGIMLDLAEARLLGRHHRALDQITRA